MGNPIMPVVINAVDETGQKQSAKSSTQTAFLQTRERSTSFKYQLTDRRLFPTGTLPTKLAETIPRGVYCMLLSPIPCAAAPGQSASQGASQHAALQPEG
jgi:hypothetical protein